MAQLVEASAEHIAADAAWLASDAHLALLESYVTARVAVAAVTWGLASYWDRTSNVIVLEKPDGSTPATEAARALALNAFHESLHARYSTDPAATAFFAKLALLKQLGNPGGDFLEVVFNRLEDERIMRRELEVSEQDADEIQWFREAVVEQRENEYALRHGAGPWTDEPVSRGDQFMVALTEAIHLPDRRSHTHVYVAALLASCEDAVTEAVTGTMADAIGAAHEILRLYKDNLENLVDD